MQSTRCFLACLAAACLSLLPAPVFSYQQLPGGLQDQLQQQQDQNPTSNSDDDANNTDCPEAKLGIPCTDKAKRKPNLLAPLILGNGADQDTDKKDRSSAQKQKPQPPELPSEFQRFVQASTGHFLPIYGASLFEDVPSTFSPLDRVPVTPDYAIGPGDQINVRVWGQVNLNGRFRVDRAGDIFIPRVGGIRVAGLKFDQLHEAIQNALKRVFRNFELDVNMGQLRSVQIFVVGQARRPGSYTVSSLSTLINALFASGGPSVRGSLRNIQLQRGGKAVTSFDLYQLLLQGDMTKDVTLMPGDVIFIPDAGPRIAVDGSVQTPAIYELKGETSLKEVLQFAGGLSPTAAGSKAIIERVENRSTLRAETVDLSPAGLSGIPRDGDIIRIFSVVPRFERTVTLRGNVSDPSRFPWHPGMRVSDLIPNTDMLLTRGFWQARNDLPRDPTAAPAAKAQDDQQGQGQGQNRPDSSLASAVLNNPQTVTRDFKAQTDVQPLAPNVDWNYATVERLNPKELTTQLLPFNLRKAVIQRDPSADLLLEPNDVVTVYSDADIAVPNAERTKFVRIEGEVAMAGVYQVQPGETLRDLLARAGGLTPSAYLYGAQFTRVSTRKEQRRRLDEYLDQMESEMTQRNAQNPTMSLNANQPVAELAAQQTEKTLIQRLRNTPVTGRIVLRLEPNSTGVDALPALPLENGDTLLVPSAPATVHVFGTVYNQGSLLYGSEAKLGDYLAESGGPTRYADKHHIFVIRADGTVIAKESQKGFLTNRFATLPMYPGDAIVVPMHIKRPSLLNNITGWSQVLGNLGVSAAAISVLR